MIDCRMNVTVFVILHVFLFYLLTQKCNPVIVEHGQKGTLLPKIVNHSFFKGRGLIEALWDPKMPTDLKRSTFFIRLASPKKGNYLDTDWFYDMFAINTDELIYLPDNSTAKPKGGSFGIARKGLYKNMPVVIKEFKHISHKPPGDSESVEREFLLNAYFSNLPGIPKAYGFRHDLLPQILVLEMIADADGELSHNIVVRVKKEKHRLTPWDVVDLCRKIILILIPIHKFGVNHGDIKRGNILLQKRADGSLHPYIIDFNLATFRHEFPAEEYTIDEVARKLRKYYQYAPELYFENISESPRSDAFSIGKIFEFIAQSTNNKIIGDAAAMLTAHYEIRETLPHVEEFLRKAHLDDKYVRMYDSPTQHNNI